LSDNNPLLPTDPRAGYLAHKAEIDAAIHGVLDNGWYILGREDVAFEHEFAAYLGTRDAIGVNSGTDALHLCLRALGVGPGDAVITVSHTAVATVAAIELAGAMPILVDVDPVRFTLDPNCLEEAIVAARRQEGGPRLKAVIAVHLYGHPADIVSICEIAGRHGLAVIEDCAQSHGATVQGRKTGVWGHMAAFSFYPTKNLGALGDGGAIATSDPALSERARLLREYGWRQRYVSDIAGTNSRLDELQAAVLRVKLRHLDAENERRQQIAAAYNAGLDAARVALPAISAGVTHVYHQYVIRTDRRDALQAHLKAQGIGSLIHYPVPVHQQPAYAGRVPLGPGGLGVTEQLCRDILSLPMYPQLTGSQIERVCSAINGFLR
jgi:dTDP-4-amino-4,6-dideoxygalactose transaminase